MRGRGAVFGAQGGEEGVEGRGGRGSHSVIHHKSVRPELVEEPFCLGCQRKNGASTSSARTVKGSILEPERQACIRRQPVDQRLPEQPARRPHAAFAFGFDNRHAGRLGARLLGEKGGRKGYYP